MATLTVRNLEEDLVRRLRIRAAENGRSAEAEHRAILHAVLTAAGDQQVERQRIADRLAALRAKAATHRSASVADLLADSRARRLDHLAGRQTGG